MPLSMTGYGNAEFSENGITLRVNIKSLNSRFLDIHLKLHRSLYEYESKINSLIKQYLERGRVTISIDIETNSDLMDELNIDKSRLKQYLELVDEISREIKEIKQPDIEFFLNNQEIIIKETKLNKEQIEICLEKSLILGLKETQKLRNIEGKKLCQDLSDRIEISCNLIEKIETITNSNWSIQVEKYHFYINSTLYSDFYSTIGACG